MNKRNVILLIAFCLCVSMGHTTENSNVKGVSEYVNKTYEVGEIGFASDISQSGAKTYNIPLLLPQGYVAEMTPQLSLSYNSQTGDGNLGRGWSLQGVSSIRRGPSSLYYDGEVNGINLDSEDAFFLDGMRLIETQRKDSTISYQSVTGHILVTGYLQAGDIKRFVVYYPTGIVAEHNPAGLSSEVKLFYFPVSERKDYFGNKITYNYTYFQNSIPRLESIDYNGCSVRFSYTMRSGHFEYGIGGTIVDNRNILDGISIYRDGILLNKYSLKYEEYDERIFFSELHLQGFDGKELNPMKFKYGYNGLSDVEIGESVTQFGIYPHSSEEIPIRYLTGRFSSVLRNSLVSYQEYDTYKYQDNKFINEMPQDMDICVYPSIDTSTPAVRFIKSGRGFVDIFGADIYGNGYDCIVKVNHYWGDGKENVNFDIYKLTDNGELDKIKSETFYSDLLYRPFSSSISVYPKVFLPGDFNGDGKTEIISISANKPFDDAGRNTEVVIYDLESSAIIYKGSPFIFNTTKVENISVFARRGSGELRYKSEIGLNYVAISDINGDGKDEIINYQTTGEYDVYCLSKLGIELYNKTNISRKSRICLGDFNGDGLSDICTIPDKIRTSRGSDNPFGNYRPGGGDNDFSDGYVSNRGNDWGYIYLSTGDGAVRHDSVSVSFRSSFELKGMFLCDVNGDGNSDIIQWNDSIVRTRIAQPNLKKFGNGHDIIIERGSSVIPIFPDSLNGMASLAVIKDGKIRKFSFGSKSIDKSLLTEVVSSYGVVHKSKYRYATPKSDDTTIKKDMQFPYIALNQPVVTIAEDEIWIDGKLDQSVSYSFSDGVIHRQGLGFCGFGKMSAIDNNGRSKIRRVNPLKFGVPIEESDYKSSKSYDYRVNMYSGMAKRPVFYHANLAHVDEYDKTTGVNVKKNFIYDSEYGNIFSGEILYNDTISEYYVVGYERFNRNKLYCPTAISSVNRRKKRGASECFEQTINSNFVGPNPTLSVTRIDNEPYDSISYVFSPQGKIISRKYWSVTDGREHDTYSYNDFGEEIISADARGQRACRIYDEYGNLSSFIDENQRGSSYKYDGFGNCIEYRSLDDWYTVERVWNSELPGSLYAEIKRHMDGGMTIEYYDTKGRLLRHKEKRFDNSYLSVDYGYDEFGRKLAESYPYKSNPMQWITYRYDAFDRIVEELNPSGANSSYAYQGRETVTQSKGQISSQVYDETGKLIVSAVNGRHVRHNYDVHGNLTLSRVYNGVSYGYEYDKFGRCIKTIDPNFGVKEYEYDADGNVVSETDAAGRIITKNYNSFGDPIQTVYPEQTVKMSYWSNKGLPLQFSNPVATNTIYYDNFWRVEEIQERTLGENGYLRKKFYYTSGLNRLDSVVMSTQTSKVVESYRYSNGTLVEKKCNGISISKLLSENEMGQPLVVQRGPLTYQYLYDFCGTCIGYKISNPKGNLIADVRYEIDAVTGNVMSCEDEVGNTAVCGNYDSYNRLNFDGHTMSYYDGNDNLTICDFGDFTYGDSSNPYRMTEAVGDLRKFNIEYASYHRPLTASVGDCRAEWRYDGMLDRKMLVQKNENGDTISSTIYLGDCFERTVESLDGWNAVQPQRKETYEKFYVGGDYYEADAIWAHVYTQQGDSIGMLYIVRDHLGTITHLVDAFGNVVHENEFDGWGRFGYEYDYSCELRNEHNVWGINRGYVGHEHLRYFGLIDMNARLYCPMFQRFLSPDEVAPDPFDPFSYNAYVYCRNNPLSYIDRDGKFPWLVPMLIGAAIGGVWNLSVKIANGQIHSFTDGIVAFGIGAGAGALGGLAGGAAFGSFAVLSASGAAVAGAGGFYTGFLSGFSSGMISGAFESLWNSAYFGDPLLSWDELLMGAAISGIIGGSINGVQASIRKMNFWTGHADTQLHHIIPHDNKMSGVYKTITDKFGLDLDGDWNKMDLVHHKGVHTRHYREWILKNLIEIEEIAGSSKEVFLKEFNARIKDVLYKYPRLPYSKVPINIERPGINIMNKEIRLSTLPRHSINPYINIRQNPMNPYFNIKNR
ncbi:RHS repeat-associated core domain-containing protein [uncultured Muribaculum sp.]|uniref:RHS repeat-associated core domain-containing protein n=1 Tax=uncultured Muribaculum sp. TaxID=1918613 RepID=UPI002628CE3B|nr:RHS repeat-associated core domain-containing protein [uncultured Muribaculum sp.]